MNQSIVEIPAYWRYFFEKRVVHILSIDYLSNIATVFVCNKIFVDNLKNQINYLKDLSKIVLQLETTIENEGI